jgi:hypothetical protein
MRTGTMGPQPPLEMSERDLQAAVEDLAQALGWITYHTWSSVHSAPGFPDFVAGRIEADGGARLVVAELKNATRRVGEAQQAWLEVCARVPGVECFLWRPVDWHAGEIDRVLR